MSVSVGGDTRLAIFGAGVMGANHARVANRTSGVQLVGIIDLDEQKRTSLATATRTANAPSLADLLTQTGVDAVVIASPTATHFELAVQCIDAGLHVLVEKPMAPTVAEATEMAERAQRAGVVLTVGHVERFNPAVRELLRQSKSPLHIEFSRVGPFTPRVSDNVVIDLMIHDLDLARALARSEVRSIQAITQATHTTGPDMAIALIEFQNGVTSSVTASRISQQRIRSVAVTEKDAVFAGDLIRQDVMIHRMQHVEYVSEGGARYRQSGVVEMPFIENRNEPLAEELGCFIRAIQTGSPLEVLPADGIAAVQLVHDVLKTAQRQGDF